MGSIWEKVVFPLASIISGGRAISLVAIKIHFNDLMMNLWKLRLKILMELAKWEVKRRRR